MNSLPGDIAHTDGIKALAAELQNKEAKGINILINNAGVSPEHRASDHYASQTVNFKDPVDVSRWMTLDGTEAWRTAYAGNVACHQFFTAALLPLLDKGRECAPGFSSSIVNISSVAGITKTSSRGQFAYSSAKAALLHLTQEWAHTFIPLRIRVNCIAPGPFPTEMTTGGSNENNKSNLGPEAGKNLPAGKCGSILRSRYGYAVIVMFHACSLIEQDVWERTLISEAQSFTSVVNRVPL